MTPELTGASVPPMVSGGRASSALDTRVVRIVGAGEGGAVVPSDSPAVVVGDGGDAVEFDVLVAVFGGGAEGVVPPDRFVVCPAGCESLMRRSHSDEFHGRSKSSRFATSTTAR